MAQPTNNSKLISRLSWEFVLALVANIIVLVWFISQSQANQDVRLEAHEQRITVNERLLASVVEERIAVGKLQVQMTQVQNDLAEIKGLLQKQQQQ